MSELGVAQRRFDERLGGLVLGIVVFGAGAGWLAWQMFVTGGNPDMMLEFLDPTTSV